MPVLVELVTSSAVTIAGFAFGGAGRRSAGSEGQDTATAAVDAVDAVVSASAVGWSGTWAETAGSARSVGLPRAAGDGARSLAVCASESSLQTIGGCSALPRTIFSSTVSVADDGRLERARDLRATGTVVLLEPLVLLLGKSGSPDELARRLEVWSWFCCLLISATACSWRTYVNNINNDNNN